MSAPTERCLLVDLLPEQRQTLGALPGAVILTGAELDVFLSPSTLPVPGTVDVVVIGSWAGPPVAVVQRVHRTLPDAGVVVVVAASEVTTARRALSYAPVVPLELLVLTPDEDVLVEVERLCSRVKARRAHREVLAAVSARARASAPPARAVVTTLGALLDHAPLGVVVCDVSGGVLAWNPRAEVLLAIPSASTGVPVEKLLAGAGAVVAAASAEQRDDLAGDGDTAHVTSSGEGVGSESTPATLAGAGGRDVEVSAVASQLDDGQRATLLLVVDSTQRRQAERARDRLRGHVDLLAEVSEALSATLESQDILERLASALVPALADWVSIQLTDDHARTTTALTRHRDPALAEVARRAQQRQTAPGARPAFAAHGRSAADGPLLLTDLQTSDVAPFVHDPTLQKLLVRLGTGSVVSVPLPGRQRTLGWLVLASLPGSPVFTQTEATVALEVARRAAVALDNATLYAQQRSLAEELQRSLLSRLPQSDHLQLCARYHPAAREHQVGGDWYDAFQDATGRTHLVIGDVTGHDREAAAAMGQMRNLLRGIGHAVDESPGKILIALDRAVHDLAVGSMATVVLAQISQSSAEERAGTRTLSWSNAGHPPPLLINTEGATRYLDSEPDLLLGLDPDSPRTDHEVTLAPGTSVLLYTDGLIERRDAELQDGLDWLATTSAGLAHLALDDLCDSLLAEVGDRADDDVALLAFRAHPEDRPQRDVDA